MRFLVRTCILTACILTAWALAPYDAGAQAPIPICARHDPVACVAARLFLRENIHGTETLRSKTREELGAELVAIDPWAGFLSPAELATIKVGAQTPASGIGARTFEENAKLLVVPLAAGAAAKAGLADPAYIDLPAPEAEKRVSSDLAAQRPLVFRRPATATKLEVSVTPADFAVPTVEAVRIDRFEALRVHSIPKHGAVSAVVAAVDRAAAARSALLLDMRYATGGEIFTALDIAALFLPVGAELGRIDAKQRGERLVAPRTPKAPLDASAIVALVGPHTASAAEAIVALLKASGVRVIGRRTYGKCAIQSVYPIGRQGAVKLTTAFYVPPDTVRDYCDDGIEPDHEIAAGEAVNDGEAVAKALVAALPAALIDRIASPPTPSTADPRRRRSRGKR